MNKTLLLILCISLHYAMAQTKNANVTPEVTTIPIEPGAVTLLHLSPGYTSSVRLPDEISSVVIGDPATFKAEHSESEPRLAFFKPITPHPAESNALITTKSGQEISLHLVSDGHATSRASVDFLLEYRQPQALLINPAGDSFLIADTKPVISTPDPQPKDKPDPVSDALLRQQSASRLDWQGKQLSAAIGSPVDYERQTILAFSVTNHSTRTIELLPPQIQLRGTSTGKKHPQIKAEPVSIADYKITTRRLAPKQRADGVVVFERPEFKEASERLQLQLAEADAVDRPLLLTVPFTPTIAGGQQ